MLIDCHSAKEWLETVKNRYNFSKTVMNENNQSIIVFYLPNYPKDSSRLLIASYNKEKKTGIVICRRVVNKPVDFDRRRPFEI